MSNKYKYDLEMPYNCKICGKEIKSKTGVGIHIKNQHKDFTFFNYLLKFEGINIENQIKKWEEGREERKEKGIIKSTSHLSRKRSPKDRMTKEQYKNWRNSMSKVFTFDWFIDKYGNEEGERLYKERSEKISKNTYFKEYNKTNKENYSKISQELFWSIYKNVDFEKVYFAELNHEYGCETKRNFDFVIIDNKKVIEFNGDKWHANPLLYEENDIPLPFTKKKAKTIWTDDAIKNNKAINNGYKIFIVWESDYLRDKEKTIKKCLDFIKES